MKERKGQKKEKNKASTRALGVNLIGRKNGKIQKTFGLLG